MDPNQPQDSSMDMMLNGFFNHEATPSILGLQVPNYAPVNSNLLNNAQSAGLQARYNVLLGVIEEMKKDGPIKCANDSTCTGNNTPTRRKVKCASTEKQKEIDHSRGRRSYSEFPQVMGSPWQAR